MTYADEQFSLVDECNCTAVSKNILFSPLNLIEFAPIPIIFYPFTLLIQLRSLKNRFPPPFFQNSTNPSRCHSHYTPQMPRQMRRWETLLEAYARADLESLLQSTRCLPFRSGSKRSA